MALHANILLHATDYIHLVVYIELYGGKRRRRGIYKINN